VVLAQFVVGAGISSIHHYDIFHYRPPMNFLRGIEDFFPQRWSIGS